MMKLLILICLSGLSLYGVTLSEVKKLHYAEQTKENVQKYKDGLETLAKKNNIEALYMLGLAYESGSHWEIDKLQALKYYEKASSNGHKKSALKLAMMEYNKENYPQAKEKFLRALHLGNTNSIKYLLEIAIIEQNKDDIGKYIDLAKNHDIVIDQLTLQEIKEKQNKKSKFMNYIEDKTFTTSKDYIVGILKIISSLDGAFKNLGYEVHEYIIHNGLEPTIELILNKIPNSDRDEEMAMLIAGDNILKVAILKSLVWANAIEPFIKKEVNHNLHRVELEVGTNAVAKIVTKRVKND